MAAAARGPAVLAAVVLAVAIFEAAVLRGPAVLAAVVLAVAIFEAAASIAVLAALPVLGPAALADFVPRDPEGARLADFARPEKVI